LKREKSHLAVRVPLYSLDKLLPCHNEQKINSPRFFFRLPTGSRTQHANSKEHFPRTRSRSQPTHSLKHRPQTRSHTFPSFHDMSSSKNKFAAVMFDTKKGGEDMMKLFVEADKDHLLKLVDLAILVRSRKGKLKAKTWGTMHGHYVALGALQGSLWCGLFGLLLLPLLPFLMLGGAVVGATGRRF
jgi:hypothetical protein